MTISVGDNLPEVTFLVFGENGPEPVNSTALFAGRKVVLFAVPGAYTPTCSTAHLPSFIRTKAALDARGVEEVICLSVNDPYVMKSWGETSGAAAAGIVMLADSEAHFTKAIGMDFTASATGLINRSVRYTMLVEDGVVTRLNVEEKRGVCELTAGETLLEQL